jgi:multiple antibiotic resistance protein
MLETLHNYLDAVITIFAIVNPIGGLPVIAALTEGFPKPQQLRVLRLAGLVALAIIAGMAVFGQFIIDYVFHINIQEFAFGGGLLLVVVGVYNMMIGSRTSRRSDEVPDAAETIKLAVTPIACPLLVGPGSVVTVMLITSRHGIFFAVTASVVAFVFVMLVLNFSQRIFRLMGQIGSLAISGVMHIFIISIGVHFMHNALVEMWKAAGR